jgi:TPP-dependent pyruvate/acetoin dehydrogenase alpha subunit
MFELSDEDLMRCYEDMLRIRLFEEKVRDELYPRHLIRGSAHLYIGEEAVAVGAMRALEPDDYVVCTYRGHAHALTKGGDPERIFAELLGRRTGYCKGKGGSMHVANVAAGFLGENGVVAANIPVGAGAALACKQLGNGRIVADFFGEGAINAGLFHETMNLASLWRLPVLFLCENNRYAISVPIERASALRDLRHHGDCYQIASERVDGMDVADVFAATARAAARARNGDGPTFLVFDTYRFAGHHLADTQRYRQPDEVVQMRREHDPIHHLEHMLLDSCQVAPDTLVEYRARVKAEIDAAAERAMAAPFPEPEDALDDVYVEPEASP